MVVATIGCYISGYNECFCTRGNIVAIINKHCCDYDYVRVDFGVDESFGNHNIRVAPSTYTITSNSTILAYNIITIDNIITILEVHHH